MDRRCGSSDRTPVYECGILSLNSIPTNSIPTKTRQKSNELGCDSVVEHTLHMCKALSLIPSTARKQTKYSEMKIGGKYPCIVATKMIHYLDQKLQEKQSVCA
jgi:hypothetical protein